jgi:hypothetical protein
MQPEKKQTQSDDVTETYHAVQLIRGARLSWAPNRVVDAELLIAEKGLRIERCKSFGAGIIITNENAPQGRIPVTRIPWTSVIVIHG